MKITTDQVVGFAIILVLGILARMYDTHTGFFYVALAPLPVTDMDRYGQALVLEGRMRRELQDRQDAERDAKYKVARELEGAAKVATLLAAANDRNAELQLKLVEHEEILIGPNSWAPAPTSSQFRQFP
jgi:hypothetical protein